MVSRRIPNHIFLNSLLSQLPKNTLGFSPNSISILLFFYSLKLDDFPSRSLYFAIPQSSGQRSLFFSPESFSLWSFIKFDQFHSFFYVNNSQICVSIPDLCPMHQLRNCGHQLDETACLHTKTLRNLSSPWAPPQWKATRPSQELFPSLLLFSPSTSLT